MKGDNYVKHIELKLSRISVQSMLAAGGEAVVVTGRCMQGWCKAQEVPLKGTFEIFTYFSHILFPIPLPQQLSTPPSDCYQHPLIGTKDCEHTCSSEVPLDSSGAQDASGTKSQSH